MDIINVIISASTLFNVATVVAIINIKSQIKKERALARKETAFAAQEEVNNVENKISSIKLVYRNFAPGDASYIMFENLANYKSFNV